jgi:DNA-binding MarR family transcriptional regulator
MSAVRSAPGPESDVGRFEDGFSRIVAWATRNDVHQATMQRARCDLPRGHIWLLARLNAAGAARLSDLAVSLGVDNSTLTPQAKRLERDGLIVREADPDDGRASLLKVTRSGKSLLARLHGTRRAMFDELLSEWPAAEQARAADLLARLADLLEASVEPDPDREPAVAAS